jgi:hypothetical protein
LTGARGRTLGNRKKVGIKPFAQIADAVHRRSAKIITLEHFYEAMVDRSVLDQQQAPKTTLVKRTIESLERAAAIREHR